MHGIRFIVEGFVMRRFAFDPQLNLKSKGNAYKGPCDTVPDLRICGREFKGSNLTGGYCVRTPTQRAIPPGSVSGCTSPATVVL